MNAHAHPAGFSLIELLVALTIASILMTVGLPIAAEMIEKTRIRTTTQEIVESFRIARMTAVHERTPITICPFVTENKCSGSNWGKGLIIVNENDELIHKIVFDKRLYITKNNLEGDHDQININANGWTPGDQSSIFICPGKGRYKNGYRIVINMSGRIRTEPIKKSSYCA